MKNSALEISNLNYSYKSSWLGKSVQALKDISLSVEKGEAFGFLGHNGAGKTTTIKCILSLIAPQSGQVRIFGRSNTETESRMSIGYLPEQPYFYDHLKVRELLEFYSVLSGVSCVERKSRINEVLSLVGMAERSNLPMRSLSKGLTQRVALAQAVVNKPRLLILDEPFSGLDPIGRREVRELIVSLKSDGVTIFMSSHVLGDVESICDRASMMIKGELKGVYKIKDIPNLTPGFFEIEVKASEGEEGLSSLVSAISYKDKFTTRYKFEGRREAESALVKLLDSNVKVESFKHEHGNLEDLFVSMLDEKVQE